MVRVSRAAAIDTKVEALKRVKQGASAEVTRATLDDALQDDNWLVVGEACEVVVQLGLRDYLTRLLAIWPRFSENAVKRDPGCRAKLAALKALDFFELLDPDPFLAAIRYRQLEPVLGGKVDTAGPVRLRSLLALMRMVHAKAALYAGELMADADAQIRAGVAQAIGYYADANSVALLTYKLRHGDDDPGVLLECALALLSVDLDFGLELMVPNLGAQAELLRETAALALAQARDGAAAEALVKWAEGVSSDADHRLAIRALGLCRHEPARRYLLELVESGATLRAREAVEALAVHRYDRHLVKSIRDAASKRGQSDLHDWVARVFDEAP